VVAACVCACACGGGAGATVDPDLAETTWCAYAWPSNYGNTGNRTFFVNQGGDTETIDDLGELMDLVSIDWTSLGGCPAPSTGLVPPKKGFPVVLATKKKLNLAYDVTWDCPNDPEQSSKDADHSDFQVEVSVDHSALGGGADADPSDDVCPRPASGDDKGCGGKDENGDIGGAIRTDVIVK